MHVDKKANTIDEVTAGKLLSNEDFNYISTERLDTSLPYTHKLELPSYWNEHRPGRICSDEAFTVERRVTPELRIEMPMIKGFYIKELAIMWCHPNLYIDEEELYKRYTAGTRFQFIVFLYAKAAELYKSLILEILPLFKEEDRETVKYRMLARTVGACALQMARELGGGLRDDIKDKKREFGVANIPQRTIDIWTDYCNLVDAWIVEGKSYRIANDVYIYNNYCQKLKAGLIDTNHYRYPPKNPSQDPKGAWRIHSPSHYLKDFLKERALALNTPAGPYEAINVKIHPVAMLFLGGAQKASGLIDSMYIPGITSYDEESAKLLDQLEGYTPKYTSPKSARVNSIDKDIALLEKNVMQAAECSSSITVKEMLQVANDGIKLLSVVHMRYKTSLDSKEESTYFGFFRSASSIDKSTYYEIFSFYMDNIFQNCLPPLLRLIIVRPDVYKDELKGAVDAVNALEEFSHDISGVDSTSARRAVKVLDGIKDLCGRENIITSRNEISSATGLRQRHLIKG